MAIRKRNGVPGANAVGYLNKMNSTAQLTRLGTELQAQRGSVGALYNFTVLGGAVGTFNLLDGDGQIVSMPNNALILNVTLDIITAPTSGGSATVAIGLNTTTDMLAATAIASLTVGRFQGVPTNSVASSVKLTADRNLTVTIGTAALTAGKFVVFVEWVQSSL